MQQREELFKSLQKFVFRDVLFWSLYDFMQLLRSVPFLIKTTCLDQGFRAFRPQEKINTGSDAKFFILESWSIGNNPDFHRAFV